MPAPARRAAAAALIAIALLAVVVRLPARQSRDVPEPQPSSPPDQVVQLHLEAVDAHDDRTLRATVHPRVTDGPLLEHDYVRRLRIIRLDEPQPLLAADKPAGVAEAVDVGVAVDVELRWLRGDPGEVDGDVARSYRVVRDKPGDPWRITAVEQ